MIRVPAVNGARIQADLSALAEFRDPSQPGSADHVEVRLTGPGGHTARPHLTADLVYALGKILTEVPAALSRRVDPRSSLSLVWGRVAAGTVANAIPDEGVAEGTVRCLDDDAWHSAPDLLKGLIDSVANSYGINAEVNYQRYVPPTVNDQASAANICCENRFISSIESRVRFTVAYRDQSPWPYWLPSENSRNSPYNSRAT